MVKNAISDYSSTAASNTDVGGVNIDEGMSPSGVNNAIRELMSHLADLNAGTSSLGTIKVDNLQLDGNAITSTDVNGNITITPNGTGNVVLDGINYPQADGTANYFLKTDGAGQLSFAQVDTASIAADAIDGTKIADDAVDSEHIADNAVGAAALNVTGTGTSGQLLTSDGDGSMTWADASGGATVSASYPSATTNGTLGDQWVHSGTGQTFVLTDATTNANVWENVDVTRGGVNTSLYPVDYLVVAAGGGSGVGGSSFGSGGGGAGGFRTSFRYDNISGELSPTEPSLYLTKGTAYTVTVGAGSGNDSKIVGTYVNVVAEGGGLGQAGNGSGGGGAGGSGGGGGNGNTAGGAGTTNQGFAGGAGQTQYFYYAGGGGGAGEAGSDGGNPYQNGGAGGDGIQSSITGTATYYAGGGSGGRYSGTGLAGGLGGGGDAGGNDGSANTGGGAGGCNRNGTSNVGGSGVVILAVPTSSYSGTTTGSPTVTTNGDFTILKYTSSGTYTA